MMNFGYTKFLQCQSEDGIVFINISQVAYFKNLYGIPNSNKVEFVMNAGVNPRVVVDATLDEIIDAINNY